PVLKINTGVENQQILDIGCGSGRLLNYIEKNFPNSKYLGIDASSGMIEEAYKEFPNNEFSTLDMTDLDKLNNKYDIIFFIASFHHLPLKEQRIKVLQSTKNILKDGGLVFMTNWDLLGEKNFIKYEKSYNGNGDFSIKIGEFSRYYHSFELKELENLFKGQDFEILENRVFDNGNNVISIIQKK
ncbi:MAG: class I SAM-dependent methyltransferase, partial [Candidatus Gracilibacteria bacterium]|nr:class I SAM-dependent methyltransferase [Candidatus Gracilibacteria bacterium]